MLVNPSNVLITTYCKKMKWQYTCHQG